MNKIQFLNSITIDPSNEILVAGTASTVYASIIPENNDAIIFHDSECFGDNN